MRHSHLSLLLACVIAVASVPTSAQQPTRLLFEITKNGRLAASPVLRLEPGREGQIHLVAGDRQRNSMIDGMRETIKVTPTIQGDNLSLAFDITTGGKANELASRRCDAPIDPVNVCRQFQPRVVVSKGVNGAIEWTSPTAGDIRLTVWWVE